MIELKHIEKHYGAIKALKGISVNMKSGEIIGLLGPNGAGKTTLIRILTCYHFPSAGKAIINGFDVTEQPLAIKKCIGYLPENAPLYQDMLVYEYLNFIAHARGLDAIQREARITTVVEQCAIKEVLFRAIHKLSKGYKQRVGLAQAILHDPEILILDEPTNGLDPNQIIEIRTLIRELGRKKTVILSTHVLQEVEALCDTVLIVNEGQLVAQGTTAEVAGQARGERRFSVQFYTDAPIADSALKDDIESIADVSAVHAIQQSTSKTQKCYYEVEVAFKSTENEYPSTILFDWIVKKRFTLVGLAQSKLKLEDIFVRLTQ